jgi:membrane-bound metal-dependent hydrolase YbcI (DUF457 family)
MDTLSHTLWGGGLFGFRGHLRLALFFGALPDLLSFGLWLPVRLMNHGFQPGPPALDTIPHWVFSSYDFSHSLLVAGIALLLVTLWRKDIAFPLLAWPFHILLDVPFHSADYFPTKIFWPVSDWAFGGIAWSNPWVWFSNLAGLAVLWAWRWQRRGKRVK